MGCQETSLYVLHLKREMRSKSLIFMAYWGCRPAFPHDLPHKMPGLR